MDSRAPERQVFCIAELFAHRFFDGSHCLVDLCFEFRRILVAVSVEVGADLGGDSEPGRYGQSDFLPQIMPLWRDLPLFRHEEIFSDFSWWHRRPCRLLCTILAGAAGNVNGCNRNRLIT
jgi:hypothetical protein